MSDQSPLTLTVPAEPTENDFIDNYDLDGNDNDYSLSEKLFTSLVDTSPLNIG